MDKIFKIIGFTVFGLAVAVALSALTAFPVMWLINGVFAKSAIFAVFGTPEVDFGTAWAFSLLCLLLVKSSGGSSS